MQLQPTIIQEHTKLIFDFTHRKLETDLAAAELNAKVRRVAVEEEAKLQQELIVKELEAWIATAVAAIAAPVAAPQKRLLTEENNIIGKARPKVMSITLCFAGLSKKKIIWIFYNKFKPINLYRLRQMWGLRFDSIKNHNWVEIEHGMLKLQKMSGIYQDFGKSFYEM